MSYSVFILNTAASLMHPLWIKKDSRGRGAKGSSRTLRKYKKQTFEPAVPRSGFLSEASLLGRQSRPYENFFIARHTAPDQEPSQKLDVVEWLERLNPRILEPLIFS